MKRKLQRHRESLMRLRRRILALRSDVEFQGRGGTIYYAVDFSEVHAWLHDDHRVVDTDEVGLSVEDREKQALQRRLGLTHLFRSFADHLYLLPPHAQELTAFVRAQHDQLERGRRLHDEARRWSDRLGARDRELLEALGAGATLDHDDLARMVALVEGEFDELCESVDEFLTWYDRQPVLNRLRDLVTQQRLDYRLPDAIAATSPPSRDDVVIAFDHFSPERRRQNRFAKHLDARALVHLRDGNRQLADRDARLLLVTRDQSIREAAVALDANPSFRGLSDRLRSIETVLLDLISRGKSSTEERLAWLGETEALLDRMQVAVEHILGSDEGSDSSLAHSGDRVLADAWEHWNAHVNLRLSLAVPSVAWLLEGFLPTAGGEARGGASSSSSEAGDDETMAREQRLLRSLGSFLASEKYRALARDGVDRLWRDLTLEGMRMLFLGSLGERTEEVIDLFAESVTPPPVPAASPRRTVLRSRRNATFGSLRFATPQYREKMSRLKPWYADEAEHFEKLRRAFYEVVNEATSGRGVPEDFLFMGFVLAMVDQWESARDLARHALQLVDDAADAAERRQPEAHYFLAVAERVIAVGHATTGIEDLRGLGEAYRQIRLALHDDDVAGPDPRYLKEQGTIALLIHHAVGHATGAAAPAIPALVDEAQAVALLARALEASGRDGEPGDRRLRIELLNNLAYVTTSGGNLTAERLAQAERWMEQVDREFDEAKHDRPRTLPDQPWPAIRDTQLMVRALGARIHSDGEVLARCLRDFDRLLAQGDLAATQQRAVANHREQVRTWVESLERR